jgi:hypothetical protein
LGAFALVLDRDRPDQALRVAVVLRRLDPAVHDQFGEAALLALFVGLLGAFAQAVQQFVDVPVLGVVVLDVAGLVEIDGDDPIVIVALGHHHAQQGRILAVAVGRHQPVRLQARHEEHGFGQMHDRLLAQFDVGGPFLGSGEGGLGGRFDFLLGGGVLRQGVGGQQEQGAGGGQRNTGKESAHDGSRASEKRGPIVFAVDFQLSESKRLIRRTMLPFVAECIRRGG